MTLSDVEAPPSRSPGPVRARSVPAPVARTTPARTAVVVTLAALVLGALFNARSLAATAAGQSPGWVRDTGVAATDVLVKVSSTLGLDRPRTWIEDALGRGETTVVAPVPGAPGEVFVPTPARPARLWVAGDSLTDTFGPALVNRSEPTGVVDARRELQFASGLNRPVFDWPGHLDGQLAAHPTDIVVFMIGANDGVPIETPGGWVGSDTEAWKSAYRERVAVTMELLAARVPTVYWVGMPIVRSEPLARKVTVMNDVFRSEAGRHPGVRYVDSWSLFAAPDGGYAASLADTSGRAVLMRRPDGVHFTGAGAERLTDAVWDAIRADWRIEP